MNKIFMLKGVEYAGEQSLRDAIFEEKRVALPPIESDEEWAQWEVEVLYKKEERKFNVECQLKLMDLNNAFENERNSSHSNIESSLGFCFNSNIDSYNNICMLIDMMEGKDENDTVEFRTFNNEMVNLEKKDLLLLKQELAVRNSDLYQQKWDIKKKIESSNTVEELDEIEVRFE